VRDLVRRNTIKCSHSRFYKSSLAFVNGMTASTSPSSRLVPAGVRRQARGRARIESILDATEQLVAEVGYDEMSTNQVARRAGISPGSLYQFFGNKADLLAGLLDRCTRQFDDLWDDQLTPAAATLPLEELVDQVLEAVVAFKAERPAFWALFHGSATSAPLADAGRRLEDQLTARLDDLYALRAPHLAPERRRLVAEVSVATVRAVMPLVTDGPHRRSKGEVLAEVKQVLIGYVGPVLEPPVDGRPPRGETGPHADR
jgi:AcrR family transcriptional regulator